MYGPPCPIYTKLNEKDTARKPVLVTKKYTYNKKHLRPSHSSRFHHQNTVWWALQILRFLILLFNATKFLVYVTLFKNALYLKETVSVA
jgi:hypothetical protein